MHTPKKKEAGLRTECKFASRLRSDLQDQEIQTGSIMSFTYDSTQETWI